MNHIAKLVVTAGFLFLLSACVVKQPPPLPATILSREAIHAMKSENGYWIEIQIPQRKLVLAKGDNIIRVFPVAVGTPEFPSPVGYRTIDSVVWNPWWVPPKWSNWVEDPTPVPPRTPDNPLGEIKMPLGRAYLIHGTRAIQSIGQWASHGCIRMLFEDIFGLVQLLLTEYSNVSAIDMMEKANRKPHEEFTTRVNWPVPVVLTYEAVKINNDYVTISPDFYKVYPDMMAHMTEVIKPFLKKKEEPNTKKIRNLLKMFKGQTIHVPLSDLVNGS